MSTEDLRVTDGWTVAYEIGPEATDRPLLWTCSRCHSMGHTAIDHAD